MENVLVVFNTLIDKDVYQFDVLCKGNNLDNCKAGVILYNRKKDKYFASVSDIVSKKGIEEAIKIVKETVPHLNDIFS